MKNWLKKACILRYKLFNYFIFFFIVLPELIVTTKDTINNANININILVYGINVSCKTIIFSIYSIILYIIGTEIISEIINAFMNMIMHS